MNNSDERRYVHCNQCGTKTNHAVVSMHPVKHTSVASSYNPYEEIEVNETSEYRLLQCGGCDHVTTHKWVYCDAAGDPDEWYFPPPRLRQLPSWHRKLPRVSRDLLIEIYTAIDNNCLRLAGMGARTLIDLYLVAQVGDKDGFKGKLEHLWRTQSLSATQKHAVEAAVNLGSAASHRAYEPSLEDIYVTMDIVENYIQTFFLSDAVATLGANVPPRPPKKSPNT